MFVKLRDDIDKFIESSFNPGQNLSNKEKRCVKKLITEINKVICVDDTDKNLGAATTDKHGVTKEWILIRLLRKLSIFTIQHINFGARTP